MKFCKSLRMKRLFAFLLGMMLLIPQNVSAAPASEDLVFDTLGEKTADALVTPGDYEITLSVPGAVETEKYSEIIVMVDASSSQGSKLDILKQNLVSIAEKVLHNDGSVRLTLMGFGMGPAYVGSFYNAETLEAYLANVGQADLRQGVSATNCEASLDFIREYIEKSDNLNKTCILYTTDGESNMDEIAFSMLDWDLHQEWHYYDAKKKAHLSNKDIAMYAADGQASLLLKNGTVVPATSKLYPEEALNLETAKALYGIGSAEFRAAVDVLFNAIINDTEENCVAYVDAVYADIMRSADIDLTAGTSTSKYEKVFLEYCLGAFHNAFLVSIHGMENAGFYVDSDSVYKYSTWGSRAAAAADKLCENEKVLELFMVDFKGNADIWMNPASSRPNGRVVTSDKITYLKSANYTAAIDTMKELSDEMFTTLYKDTTITDPMSKWVDLDPTSIRIYEDDLVIWTAKDGWLYEDKQPAKNPVTVTGDAETGYTIEWRIKDGPLYYTDRYFLKYVVSVDETVEGFEYDTMYPANDPTYVTYTDAQGEEQKKDIVVPEVKKPTEPDDFKEEDLGVKIFKGTKEGKPLSDITFNIYKVVPAEGDVLSSKPEEAEYSKYAVAENLIASITTDAAGYAALNLTEKGLGEGIYLITENDSEKVVEPVAPFYVALPMIDEEGNETKVVSIYPKNVPVEEEKPPKEPEIPEDPKKKETGKIAILKHQAGAEDRVLAGAEFQLYRLAKNDELASADAITYTIEAETEGEEATVLTLVPATTDAGSIILTTNEAGYAETPELPYGLYFLVETKAPVGFHILDDPIAVWCSSTSELDNVKVPNTSIALLPETGGMGTTFFTLAGTLILAVGVVLILRRQKKRS